MGHMVGKEAYRKLGKKIDNLPMRAPWNETFYEVLKEIYSEEEADVVVRMPYGLSDLDRVGQDGVQRLHPLAHCPGAAGQVDDERPPSDARHAP